MHTASAPWTYLDEALQRGHVPVRRALQRLVDQVGSVAPDEPVALDEPEPAASLLDRVLALRELILDHLRREEAYVFPLLRVPVLRMNQHAIRLMQRDHGQQLDCLRETRAFVACQAALRHDDGRWAAVELSLAHLERTLAELILLEEDHLYAPALAFA